MFLQICDTYSVIEGRMFLDLHFSLKFLFKAPDIEPETFTETVLPQSLG